MRLVLDAEPGAVRRARRLAAEVLRDLAPDLVHAAELIVTELVTNAVLHGQAPIAIRIQRVDDGARVEVTDRGRDLPFAPPAAPLAMTGRGLALVAASASAWGVDLAEGGKTVWADLRPRLPGDPAVAPATLPSATAPIAGETYYDIEVPGVDVGLLLAAKSHSDTIVRELKLAMGPLSREEPTYRELTDLVAALETNISGLRTQATRQAAGGTDAGEAISTVCVRLPASAITALERHGAAFAEADRYARTARLLTLEAPPVQSVFRSWFIHAVLAQLRARAAGTPPPPLLPFATALAAEVTRLAGLSAAAARLATVQRVTSALADAHSLQDIAGAVTTEVADQLGAQSARVYLRHGDVFRSLARRDGTIAWADQGEDFALDADLPGADAARAMQPLVLRGRAQLAERYPHLADRYPDERTLHVAPLIVNAQCIGLLSLTFALLGVDDATQTVFVSTLADTVAQSLDRALGMERLAEANARLTEANARLGFLADASAALSGSLDYQTTLDEIPRLMVPRLADWCSIQLLDDAGQLNTIALMHSDPERVQWARELARRYPTRMDSSFGAANVIRTGRSELYTDLPAAMLESAAVDAEHLELIRQIAFSSALIVPLATGEENLGALSLVYAESGRRYGAADVAFAEDIARRAALALRSAGEFREQTGKLASLQRVADAAQRAILAPPPARIGPIALAARYVAAAAEAQVGGDLYEVVERPGSVRLLIGDVRGKGLAAVRCATIVLGEFRAIGGDAGVPEDDLAAVAARLDRRMRPYFGPEDFVTAQLVEIATDGTFAAVTCGHPPPLLLSNHQIMELPVPPGLPLGLGAAFEAYHGRLDVGDRLLLYTDGAIEARDSRRRFIDIEDVLAPGLERDLPGVLDAVISGLRRRVGRTRLGDDLALLIAEYCPDAVGVTR